ncbi:hypothetical protein [Burkholderia cepacia]|uniref:hypothetical protein n=1 Tax=Burkholderia cepacia TaxID=292 RepID=UPI0012D857A5|nr:hypothetical protein [Burkholderia cepacia]
MSMPRAAQSPLFNDVRIATEGNAVIVNVAERPAIGTIDFIGHHGPPRRHVVPGWQARTYPIRHDRHRSFHVVYNRVPGA